MGTTFRFGPYQLDGQRRTLLRDGTPVPVTARAFDVLQLLVAERARVVEKDELLSRVWPDQTVEEGNLTQQVFVLRRLLGDGEYIVTVPRRGYQFVAPVTMTDHGRQEPRLGTDQLHLDLALDPPLVLGPNPSLALSRDGRLLVYVGDHAGTTALYARRLDSGATRVVTGTEGGSCPCLSPDGRWIAYAANGRLLRVGVDGGRPLPLCEVDGVGRGVAWGADNLVVFAPVPAGPLYLVAATGGTPRPLTRLAYNDGDRSHRFPSFTRSGHHVVFTVSRAGDASFEHARLAVVPLAGGPYHVLLEGASCARTTGESALLCHRGGVLLQATFAPGSPSDAGVVDVQDPIAIHEAGAAHVAGADGGLLIYAPAATRRAPARLVWVDSEGSETDLHEVVGMPEEPRLAPDGTRIVVGVRSETSDLWLHDLERGTFTRLTESHDNFAPVWTPDGREITFSSNRAGPSNLHGLAIGTPGPVRRLHECTSEEVPGSWQPDGQAVLFTRYNAEAGVGIWRLDRSGAAHSVSQSRFREYMPSLSHDGRWLAYVSDATGTPEVYVVEYPSLVGRQQVSRGGASEPVWAPCHRHLYFRTPAAVLRVNVGSAGQLSAPDTVVMDRYVRGAMTGLSNYDVHPDGRLLMVAHPERPRFATVLRAVVPLAR